MEKLKKFGRSMLGLLFASMPWILWCLIFIGETYVFVKYIEPTMPYMNLLEYGWGTIGLYFGALVLVWLFISDYKFNLVSALYVSYVGRYIFEWYLIAEITGRYILFIVFTAAAVGGMVIIEIVSTFVLKYYKLEDYLSSNSESDFWDMSDLFDDDDDEDFEEDDGMKEILKIMNSESYYVREYPVMIRKVLKEHGNDNKVLSNEEQEAWNKRVEKAATIIEEHASSGIIGEHVYSYFYIAYFCGEKYKDIFSKEKANQYLKIYINKGLFKEDVFNRMVEEAVADLSTEKKFDLITEVYETVRPMVSLQEYIETNRLHEEKKNSRLEADVNEENN